MMRSLRLTVWVLATLVGDLAGGFVLSPSSPTVGTSCKASALGSSGGSIRSYSGLGAVDWESRTGQALGRRQHKVKLATQLRMTSTEPQPQTAKKPAAQKDQKPKRKGGTDEKILKLGRSEMFPKKDMDMQLDLDDKIHHGGAALRRLYHDSERVLIVDYYKDGCSMCRVLRPLIRQVIDDLGDRCHFVELEVLENKDVISQAGLRGVPTVHIFKRGMLVNHFNGLHSKRKLRQTFEAALDTFEFMSDQEVQTEFDRRKAAEVAAANKGSKAHMLYYPFKKMYAPGRVLYPAHWNYIFQQRKEDQMSLMKNIETFLNNDNCLTEDHHNTYIRALRKSDVGKVQLVSGEAGSGNMLVGRIHDGETNLRYGTMTLKREDMSSQRDILIEREPDQKDGLKEPVGHEVCNETGCTLIFYEDEV